MEPQLSSMGRIACTEHCRDALALLLHIRTRQLLLCHAGSPSCWGVGYERTKPARRSSVSSSAGSAGSAVLRHSSISSLSNVMFSFGSLHTALGAWLQTAQKVF